MMKFFNYLFYQLHWWNTEKIWSVKKDWFFSCISGLTFFQTTNILTVYILIMLLLKKNAGRIDYIFLTIAAFLLILNHLYYKKNKRYELILKKNKKETISFKKRYNIFCITYIFLTFLFIAIALYLGRTCHY